MSRGLTILLLIAPLLGCATDGGGGDAAAAGDDRSWYDAVVGARVGLFNPAARGTGDDRTERLRSLGYLQGYESPGAQSGVVLHDAARAADGYNLYTSGHAPTAVLMTQDGEVVHTWSHDFDTACPEAADRPGLGRHWWRRALLLPDGGLLAIFDYMALVRLDRDSNLLWARCDPFHHDLALDDEGRVLALEASLGERIEDFVTYLGEDGRTIDRFSLLDALEDSPYASYLQRSDSREVDTLHTNTLKILEGRIAASADAFAAGRLLVSFRNIDVIAAVDPAARRVTWALSGMWHAQHEPVETPDGTILLFDNLAPGGGSRVLEIDPLTQRVVWSADGFSSPVCGSNQRLANGNTLVVESTAGRAFEVTPDGRPVWEFVSPHRVDDGGEELVAILGALERIDAARVESWLEASR